jgi:AmmeMemoRadiSam system protein B/AmmeMemoRadiSam system protein A
MRSLAVFAGFVLFLPAGDAVAQIHKTPMAGQWFPANKEALNRALGRAFDAAGKRAGMTPARPGLRALIVPHAAIDYSGVVAASSYRLLGKPGNVILLAFSHSRPLTGVVAPDVDAYQTPLRTIKVNRHALASLGFPETAEKNLCDHSLENQLPFLQRAVPNATLIPLYVGDLTKSALAAAARKLATRLAKGDILIASSDFTHYGKVFKYTPYPNDKMLPERLLHLSLASFEEIGSLNLDEFDGFLAESGDTICGRNPIRLLMATLARLPEDIYMETADYMASGDLTRDYSLSVSYGALAFYPASAYRVSEGDQRRLLESARATVIRSLANGRKMPVPVPREERDASLRQHTRVFVTVRTGGRLRGCMGTLSAKRPLWDTVADRTLAAISADPRFSPVGANEGPVNLEISLLTPPKRIKNWQAFHDGLGAILILDGKSGTLLPQVAREMRLTPEQFLENLGRKAGAGAQAYRNPKARLYVYDAQVFGDQPAEAPTATSAEQ